MKHNVMLTVASLLSILFFTFHLADDIVRGMEPGKLTNLTAVPIFVVWLYGTLVLAERRSGYIIMLLGSLGGLGILVLHMRGAGLVSILPHSKTKLSMYHIPLCVGSNGRAKLLNSLVSWHKQTVSKNGLNLKVR